MSDESGGRCLDEPEGSEMSDESGGSEMSDELAQSQNQHLGFIKNDLVRNDQPREIDWTI